MPASTPVPATQSLIAGLLRAYLGLETDQVAVYNQKWKVPADARLYLVVSSVGPQRAFGAMTRQYDSTDGKQLLEDASVSSREMIGVDLYSAGQAAVDQKEQVLAALASTAMQQLCEAYSIKVARIPITFVDASEVEGTTRLNRFHLAFAVLRTRTTTRTIAYYSDFTGQPALAINP